MCLEANKMAVRRYFEQLNKGNVGYADEYLGPDYKYHGPLGTQSREEFPAAHKAVMTAFPDLKAIIEDQVAEGDKVVTRYTIYGTHQGDFQGIAPTGTKVNVTGIVVSQLNAGLEVEAWEEMNLLAFMQQLGAIPESA